MFLRRMCVVSLLVAGSTGFAQEQTDMQENGNVQERAHGQHGAAQGSTVAQGHVQTSGEQGAHVTQKPSGQSLLSEFAGALAFVENLVTTQGPTVVAAADTVAADAGTVAADTTVAVNTVDLVESDLQHS